MNRAAPQHLPWERCPYLGLHDDSSTSLSYASPWNYCYRANPPDTILVSYQGRVCLCPQYDECVVYHSNTWGRLPRNLRGRSRAGRLRNPVSSKVIRLVVLLLLVTILTLLLLYSQRLLP